MKPMGHFCPQFSQSKAINQTKNASNKSRERLIPRGIAKPSWTLANPPPLPTRSIHQGCLVTKHLNYFARDALKGGEVFLQPIKAHKIVIRYIIPQRWEQVT